MSPAELADLEGEVEIARHNVASAEDDVVYEQARYAKAVAAALAELRAAEREVARYRENLAKAEAELAAAVAEVAA